MLLAGGSATVALAGLPSATARPPKRTLAVDDPTDVPTDRDASVALVSERLEQWVDAAIVDGRAVVDAPTGLSVERADTVRYAGGYYDLTTEEHEGRVTLRARACDPTADAVVHTLAVPPLAATERALLEHAVASSSPEPLPPAVVALVSEYDFLAFEDAYYALRN